jgi:hypothetical protein
LAGAHRLTTDCSETIDDKGKRPLNIAKKLLPDWSVGITAGQTSSEVHEAIARFR